MGCSVDVDLLWALLWRSWYGSMAIWWRCYEGDRSYGGSWNDLRGSENEIEVIGKQSRETNCKPGGIYTYFRVAYVASQEQHQGSLLCPSLSLCFAFWSAFCFAYVSLEPNVIAHNQRFLSIIRVHARPVQNFKCEYSICWNCIGLARTRIFDKKHWVHNSPTLSSTVQTTAQLYYTPSSFVYTNPYLSHDLIRQSGRN